MAAKDRPGAELPPKGISRRAASRGGLQRAPIVDDNLSAAPVFNQFLTWALPEVYLGVV